MKMKSWTVRSHLGVFAIVTVLPVVLFAAGLAAWNASVQRRLSERAVTETTRALSLAVDRELGRAEALLTALASSPLIDAGDFASLHRQAAGLAGDGWITVIRPDGEQLMNTLVPFGTPVPRAKGMEVIRAVVETRRPVVSDLYVGAAARRPVVSVSAPAIRGESVLYSVDISFGPERFTALLREQRLPDGWLASIFDRNGVILAHTRDPEQSVGRRVSEDFAPKPAGTPEGFTAGMTRDGVPVYGAWVRSGVSGWTVRVAVAQARVDAPVRRTLWATALGGAALLAIALALAVTLGRRIARPIRALAQAASALGRGEDIPEPSAGSIAEVEEVQRALVQARTVARERETEREWLAREQSAREAAERANHAKDEFLAMLGHELRNPLGAIASAVAVLERTGQPEEPAERARIVIGRQVQHLSRLVDDLLDVSRVTSGKVVLVQRSVDLGKLVTDMMSVWRAAGRFDRHEVTVATASSWVNGDDTRLEQVTANLVGNALKFTPPGGRVGVRVMATGDTVVLEVADTGIGIPSGLIDRIFEVFVQGDPELDRAQGGLGLGLTLVRMLVEKHGGTVQAASAGQGQGATFTVRLPRVAPSARQHQPPTTAAAHPPRRVLVIEDNDDAREMLRIHLTRLGHTVQEAVDGPSGLEAALAFRPDVALVDIGLPGLDGYELARRLRADGRGQGMYLVALTGYGQPEDQSRAREAGFDAHVVKPVDPDELPRIMMIRHL